MLLGLLSTYRLSAQVPFEVFVGHEKASVDLMFFKFFKKKNGDNSPFLFFNRNRASIDYRMTDTSYLPQFGFTEAISYNPKKLKGFAPVAVGQVLSWGVFPKAGIQYAHTSKRFTAFTWLVSETMQNPKLDYYFLLRYKPRITKKLNLFNQLEFLAVLPTNQLQNRQFYQRARLGIEWTTWQAGVGIDLSQVGRTNYQNGTNYGAFVRHIF